MKRMKGALILGAFLFSGTLVPVTRGEMVDFPAGSLIIPMDPCWQPNGDDALADSFRPPGCESAVDDQGIFRAYGLVFELLRQGCPVAWSIRADKVGRQELDFIIDGNLKGEALPPVAKQEGAAAIPVDPPARTIRWSEGGRTRSETFAAHVIDYRGGPFVIHHKDLDAGARSALAAFSGVKVHLANTPFSAPVAKFLHRLSPGVAILGEGNRALLDSYLLAAGLGEGRGLDLEAVPLSRLADRPLDGRRYSLLWAPHWNYLDEGPAVPADRHRVMGHIGQFMADGNSALFGCAAIGSVEGIEDRLNPARNMGSAAPAAGPGWLVESAATMQPEENLPPEPGLLEEGGAREPGTLVFDGPADFLAQCAGWEFRPPAGRVGGFRPRPVPWAAGFNPTVTRLVHGADDPAAPDRAGFDYLAGGRLFGGPDHGVAGYLAGHDHLRCRSGLSPSSPETENELTLSLEIDGVLTPASIINLRLDHDGRPEPLIGQLLAGGSGARTGDDARLMVDLDGISLRSSGEQTVIGNIRVANLDAMSRTVTGFLVDWSGDADSYRLLVGSDPTPVAGRRNVVTAVRWTLAPMNPGISTCVPDWRRSNTCGARFVYNALLGLQHPDRQTFATRAAPVLDDGLLVVGSYQVPGNQGRLQAFDLRDGGSSPLWDAQEAMPPAGTGNPAEPTPDNASRYLFTNEGNSLIPFDAAAAGSPSGYLHRAMGLGTVAESRAWINTFRGRAGATPAQPSGTGERPYRLGGIRESTPAVVGPMALRPDTRNRDRIVYAGADDGMLHAFHAGTRDASTAGYSSGSGREVWAYLPSALLPYLRQQDFTDPTAAPAVTVSGSPAVADVLLPVPGSGNGASREWRTVLVGTASIGFNRGGVCFALDITDPYAPRVLWEKEFPTAANLGWSRGAALGPVRVGGEVRNRVFLTAGYRDRLFGENESAKDRGAFGINALALDLATGEAVWQFRRNYDQRTNVAGPPAIPALLDHDDNGAADFLVFGDPDGRLWVLDARDGTSVKRSGDADQPVFPQPDPGGRLPDLGPIEFGVALAGSLAIFGTSGSEFAGGESSAQIHAMRISGGGAAAEFWVAGARDTANRELLAAGERLRGSPVIDGRGRVYLTTDRDPTADGPTGRIRILDLEGRLLASLPTGEIAGGGMAVADGVAVASDAAGTNYIIGRPSPGRGSNGVKVKVFSWRLR